MEEIVANVRWESETVFLDKRVFLFCIGEKCMSGRINKFKKLESPGDFEIRVDFIEPDYFGRELTLGVIFTVREASKILGEGRIKEII